MISWLTTSLFCLGVLFIPVGLALILFPAQVLAWGNSVNRWISTTAFFGALDLSRDHERFYYKYHRFFGGSIMILAAISIYMLAFYTGMDATVASLQKLAVSLFGKWLLETCYYILIGLCGLALVAGLVIFVRPSLLKSLEAWSNRWIDTQGPLQRFDVVHEIPTNILPGKPRLFGCFVLLGALYITYITGVSIF